MHNYCDGSSETPLEYDYNYFFIMPDCNDDDGQEAWIGYCGNEDCGRWYHYWSARFKD